MVADHQLLIVYSLETFRAAKCLQWVHSVKKNTALICNETCFHLFNFLIFYYKKNVVWNSVHHFIDEVSMVAKVDCHVFCIKNINNLRDVRVAWLLVKWARSTYGQWTWFYSQSQEISAMTQQAMVVVSMLKLLGSHRCGLSSVSEAAIAFVHDAVCILSLFLSVVPSSYCFWVRSCAHS